MTARMNLFFAATLFFGLIFSGCSDDAQPAQEDNVMKIQLVSTAFSAGQPIPPKYTALGHDVSPPLEWTITSALPQRSAQIKSFALICDDPDAPMGAFTHWIIYNISAATTAIPENVAKNVTLPNGAKQGRNSFGYIGYNGPAPPPGKLHHYIFKFYALDTILNPDPGPSKRELLNAMNGHVLAEGELMGTFQSQ